MECLYGVFSARAVVIASMGAVRIEVVIQALAKRAMTCVSFILVSVCRLWIDNCADEKNIFESYSIS